MAIDQESGDATSATVVVEVLNEGQSSKDLQIHTHTHTFLTAYKSANFNYLCVWYSSSQSTGGWPSDKLYCGQGVFS